MLRHKDTLICYGKKMRYFLVLISVLVCAACNETEAQPKKENVEKVDCTKDVYVKIGGHVLKFSSEKKLYLRKNNKQLRTGCLQTKPDEPLEVDEAKFGLLLGELGFWVKMADLNQPLIQNEVFYQEMLDDIKKKGKAIYDLPKIGGFYKYEYSTRKLYRYFAVEDSLKDVTGVPLVLNGCGIAETAFLCTPVFRWKHDVKVVLSSGYDHLKKQLPIKIWYELYPQIVEKLNNLEYHSNSHGGE